MSLSYRRDRELEMKSMKRRGLTLIGLTILLLSACGKSADQSNNQSGATRDDTTAGSSENYNSGNKNLVTLNVNRADGSGMSSSANTSSTNSNAIAKTSRRASSRTGLKPPDRTGTPARAGGQEDDSSSETTLSPTIGSTDGNSRQKTSLSNGNVNTPGRTPSAASSNTSSNSNSSSSNSNSTPP